MRILALLTGLYVCLAQNLQCPNMDGMMGICVEACSSDGDCNGAQKCCSNGCGHTCMEPVPKAEQEKEGSYPEAEIVGSDPEPEIVGLDPESGESLCDVGWPIRNRTTHQDLFCGLGPRYVDCPHMSYCKVDPVDRFAVCCPCNAHDADRCGPDYEMDPCKYHTCDADEMCIKRNVMCYTTPCPPLPRCVSCNDTAQCPCRDKPCRGSQECMNLPGDCQNDKCPRLYGCFGKDDSTWTSDATTMVAPHVVVLLTTLVTLLTR